MMWNCWIELYMLWDNYPLVLYLELLALRSRNTIRSSYLLLISRSIVAWGIELHLLCGHLLKVTLAYTYTHMLTICYWHCANCNLMILRLDCIDVVLVEGWMLGFSHIDANEISSKCDLNAHLYDHTYNFKSIVSDYPGYEVSSIQWHLQPIHDISGCILCSLQVFTNWFVYILRHVTS